MRGIIGVLFISLAFSMFAENPVPYLRQNGNVIQLIVDNQPFLMIAGELHNSSSSTIEYMEPIWKKLQEGNLNTVLLAVSWQQVEPQEGVFNFSLVDSWIKSAEIHGLKLVFLWFGTWKNGESSYVPDWVKKDTRRFFRVKDKNGKSIETISPFCEEAQKADAKAFRKLMLHLAEVDLNRTVIMIQPENEMGVFQEMDFSVEAKKAFDEEVPEDLIHYLKKCDSKLSLELRMAWLENGKQEKGNWTQVFGDTPYAKEFFMAAQYARYVDFVAGQGKSVYPLPMFVNAWIIQHSAQLPGEYPNGGPVSRVLDIYKALAKNIDILSPDIYLPDFKKEVSKYKRADNPLLVPESKYEPGRAFYAFAECDALCFSIFGIEDYTQQPLLQETHHVLRDLHPLIVKYQATGRLKGFLRYKESSNEVALGKYVFHIAYPKSDRPAFGMIIQTGEDEFVVAGMNFNMTVKSVQEDKTAYFLQIWEGTYGNGKWESSRLLNGDETLHNSQFRTLDKCVEKEYVPGIYQISTYIRE